MFNIYLKNLYFISILFLNLFSCSISGSDTINLNNRGCLFTDKVTLNEEIISFYYQEGYYRAIHANYAISKSQSVKMTYLGDSTKDFFLACVISPNNIVDIIKDCYRYYIPCYVPKLSDLKEGTYCIEIVATLVGDINSESYCSNSYTFKAIKSTSIPSLTITGFSSDQQGCIQKGDTFTLLAQVSNYMSKSQDYNILGIELSNTEIVENNIPLQCKITGGVGVGSYDKIICIIPTSASQYYYSVLYSNDYAESSTCPINRINSFNSLNFGGKIKKLNIYQESYSTNIKVILDNISLDNSLSNKGLFTLILSLNNVQNTNNLDYTYFQQKDIGIKLIDKFGSKINTICNFENPGIKTNTFNISCMPDYYNNDIQYSLLIEDEIFIGHDQSYIICTYESTNVYKKITIPPAEFDFFIIYGENATHLDCHQNQKGFSGRILKSANYLCGSCSLNCATCKNIDICYKCMDGFSLINLSNCNLITDTINFTKFQNLERYIPHSYNYCNSINDTNPKDRQLFSFKFTYIVNQGENVAFDSEKYNNIIYAFSERGRYGLNCIVDVNPNYIESEQYYGNCRQSTCNLEAFVNCSFNGKVSNGIYDIEGNSDSNLGKLINRAKMETEPIKIKFTESKIIVNMHDKINIIYSGYGYPGYSENIYLCPTINSDPLDCDRLLSCELISYDSINDETKFQCSQEDVEHEFNCKKYEGIMLEDYCDEYSIESFKFQYCPNSERMLFINFIKSIILLIFLF